MEVARGFGRRWGGCGGRCVFLGACPGAVEAEGSARRGRGEGAGWRPRGPVPTARGPAGGWCHCAHLHVEAHWLLAAFPRSLCSLAHHRRGCCVTGAWAGSCPALLERPRRWEEARVAALRFPHPRSWRSTSTPSTCPVASPVRRLRLRAALVAMLRREGQRNSRPKQVRFQLPTRDWREEREWERRETAAAEVSAPANPLTGSPCVLVERGQIGKDGRPPLRQNWWRRLLARLRGWDKPCRVKTAPLVHTPPLATTAPCVKETPFAEPVYSSFDLFSLCLVFECI